jgi:hypothetical protein
MRRKSTVTYSAVAALARELALEQGFVDAAQTRAIRARLESGGSPNVIQRHLRRWRQQEAPSLALSLAEAEATAMHPPRDRFGLIEDEFVARLPAMTAQRELLDAQRRLRVAVAFFQDLKADLKARGIDLPRYRPATGKRATGDPRAAPPGKEVLRD